MKKLFLAFAVTMMAILPMTSSHADKMAEKSSDATLYAVAFHADWCGSCKTLGPNVIKARGQADLDNQNVLFVKLDLTDKATRSQAELMANALGLGDFYKENNGKTGFVLLVNSKTGETVGKLTKDMSSGDIKTKIHEQIKAL